MATARYLRPVNDEYDPFAADGTKSGYDPDKLYPGLHHGKQNSEVVSGRVDDFVIGMISQIVASGVIPEFKTASDFLRDSLVHNLHRVSERLQDGRLKTDLHQHIMLADVQMLQTQQHNARSIIEGYENIFEQSYRDRDKVLLGESIDKAEMQLEFLRPAFAARLQRLVDLYRERLRDMDS